jgi:hypothetical protein
MRLVGKDETVRELERLVDHLGEDYVYPRFASSGSGPFCRYELNGCADCGVARVLAELGVPIEILTVLDDRESIDPETVFSSERVQRILADAGFVFTPAAVCTLGAFQSEQDFGKSYGHALSYAKDIARRVGG